MSNKNSLKFGQGGHIVIHSQDEEKGHTGVLVVSNTTPMTELDNFPSTNKQIPLVKPEPKGQKVANRISSEVEKNVRIRNTRIPSARSQASNSGVKKPPSREGSAVKKQVDPFLEEPFQSPEEGVSPYYEKEVQDDEKYRNSAYEEQAGRLDLYNGEEENYICYRFPHLKFCVCGVDYNEIKQQQPVEVYKGIFIATLPQSLITKNLLRLGITHVLNLSAVEFTKRKNYFEYLNFDIFDSHDEDIKKHFRITNRFITEALTNGGKVLIHSFDSKSRAPAFILAYLIGKQKKTLKNSMELIKKLWPATEINQYFFKQLEQYDLEKLAIGSNIKA